MEKPLKAHTNIIAHVNKIKENYKLMQLYVPPISVQGKRFVSETIKDFEFEFNKTALQKMMLEDGFGTYDWSDLFAVCRRITLENK